MSASILELLWNLFRSILLRILFLRGLYGSPVLVSMPVASSGALPPFLVGAEEGEDEEEVEEEAWWPSSSSPRPSTP